MKNIALTPTNPTTYFTVTKSTINNHNTLLPSILYEEMQKFAAKIIAKNTEIVNTPAKLYKLEILNNAFLNDILLFESKIIKFNDLELQLAMTIKKENTIHTDLICKAIFKFDLQKIF